MGSLSAKVRSGGGPRPRSNGSKSGPLRKVVAYEWQGGRRLETYECGHTGFAKRDMMGETNAERRRCWKCKLEQPEPAAFVEWPAWIHLGGWHGNTKHAVIVVGETPKRYRIRTIDAEPVRLAGRNRWLVAGETVLVPKHAVTRRDEDAPMITRTST